MWTDPQETEGLWGEAVEVYLQVKVVLRGKQRAPLWYMVSISHSATGIPVLECCRRHKVHQVSLRRALEQLVTSGHYPSDLNSGLS